MSETEAATLEEEAMVEEPGEAEEASDGAEGTEEEAEQKSTDGNAIEPYLLKDYLIPKDRPWVLPVFLIILVAVFGYYTVTFMGAVDDVCAAQEEMGDMDCDGYPDDPVADEASEDASEGDDSTSTNEDGASGGA